MLVQLIWSSAFFACQNQPLTPSAYTIDDLSQTIGGPKALAQPGDIMLENEYLRAAIIGKRPSMGPHTDGGGLIDADIQRRSPEYANGNGNDQLAEIFATVNMNVPYIDADNGVSKFIGWKRRNSRGLCSGRCQAIYFSVGCPMECSTVEARD